MGLLKDGYNSFMRYVLNNFYDGFRQVRKEFFSFKDYFFLEGWY
jgi:protein involved in sex pheromone biosynthesis